MTLSALLVCVDEAAAQVLRQVLEELSIGVESCPDFVRAGVRLAQERYDLVIVDAKSNAEVISLLRDTRSSRLNDATLAVAVVAGQESIREMFSLGVNFVLYKPVAYDRAQSSLRAAREVLRKEKRKNARSPVHAQATIDYANIQQERATLVDLAQEGMQVQFGKKLPPVSKVYFQFKLPSQTANIRLSGQVVWQEWNGRAGIQFVDVPKTSRRLLTDFLAANGPNDSRRERFPDVTVVMEEPLQLATVSVGEQTHGSMKTSSGAYQTAQEAAPASNSADNRRTQARYACRLGAEVYRTGIPVPNHCCLTDLSSGGCYLEIPLSFPQGASVEIVVRTYEMKLRLRGTIQASHPGYGVGVAFELKAREEQANVNKLIDFVASTTEPSS
ncbi:MAG TPA: PilZ domain-containing protein [Candidatus Binatus sp.]|nr:PilZ domain-containing protein [Candidatus Binatus sp.]